MSYGGYQQYGGNPYGQAEAGYGGHEANPNSNPNPYEGTTQGGYATSNPYGSTLQNEQSLNPPPLNQVESSYSQGSQYSRPSAPPTHQGGAPLSQAAFFARVEGVKSRINNLSSSIQSIASLHQRLVSSPDNNASRQLESLVTDTQIRNTEIKDEIKFLERDVARENNSTKKNHIESLKRTFRTQLQDFEREESDYRKRYREAIARQYRIVNPDATEEEVTQAANADWGDEGIFQQALKSNRSGQATNVLGAVRARHNDIQRIEKTIAELALLFQQLDEEVVLQEQAVVQAEQHAEQVDKDLGRGNEELNTGIIHARRTRKLKWWTLGIVVLIIAILALVLGLWFGWWVPKRDRENRNNA